MNQTQKVVRIKELTDSLPHLNCQQKCQDSCGPIFFYRIEFKRMEASLPKILRVMDKKTLTCPLLRGGLCSVYENRPMICRLWGLTPEMKCPHGCEPERWVDDQEAHDLLKEIQSLSEGIIYGFLPGYSGQVPRRVAAEISCQAKKAIR